MFFSSENQHETQSKQVEHHPTEKGLLTSSLTKYVVLREQNNLSTIICVFDNWISLIYSFSYVYFYY